ncbi:TadE/TadG family type IV pilus assembly protein, partial [Streptomyces sp. NPDC007369]|uniref:TadE/TadG family type IV pilus assembly protein n=1 Tax=Streptomyces sp. NPDC007369 TaxID=3154589 RepID=UPI0033F94D2D
PGPALVPPPGPALVPPPGTAPSARRAAGPPGTDRPPAGARGHRILRARAYRVGRSCAYRIGRRGVRGRGDRGQVAVEFVGMVPLILLLVAAVWECVLIGYAFSLAGNAADEAARAGAVKGGAACEAAGIRHISAAWGPEVICGESGDVYKATVRLKLPVLYPGLNIDTPIEGVAGSPVEKED